MRTGTLAPLALTAEEETVLIKSSTNYHHNEDRLKSDAAPDVFLGGSTNPTTWRADIAIPTLEKWGISFYNPQVTIWTPDLIEPENRRKEEACVLFFVIDSQTRAVASSIEVAYIAGHDPKKLVLVINPYKPGQCISNEPISPEEYLELNSNQEMLRELVVRRSVPISNEVLSGLHQTRAIITGDSSVPISYQQELLLNDDKKSFDLRDIYVDGISSLRTNWRNKVISMLKRAKVTYYMPQNNLNVRLYNQSLLESSRVLLFFIASESRSLATMTLAAHYIGLGYNIVLYIKELKDGCTIENDRLTKIAVNDYNRGRYYLRDVAKLNKIPVFDDLENATRFTIEKLKSVGIDPAQSLAVPNNYLKTLGIRSFINFQHKLLAICMLFALFS
ncbi:uncharacterized protein LOC116350486 isoform X2 [Contarinia nasturtii]|uniref:uncharacterized protein LOC116350486 isoform X2 n=1 Tax=Contarinia nasturtii TaxID=265458 RepID=UPI0012D46008|nr:uncharacterized protein LOC116350486 isoform X2 [Contarinia nasturtii]